MTYGNMLNYCSLTNDLANFACTFNNRDSNKPIPSSCQNVICGDSGWALQNMPDGTSCEIGGKVCTGGNCGCLPPLEWDSVANICKTPEPTGCDSDGNGAIDTSKDSCCVYRPGEMCKDIGGGTYDCVADASCPTCIDGDNGLNIKIKATCKDSGGGTCDYSSGGCTDTCASSGSVIDYYCAGSNPLAKTCMLQTIACPSSEFCYNGVCDSVTYPVNPSDPPPTPVGCTWLATNFNPPFGVCSSGCPPSYADQQFVCCETAPLGCRNAPECVSYNPQNGETPCCTTGGYYTCTAEETCTETQNTSRKVYFV